MNPRRSFLRKIIYLVFIGLLLIPLHWLSHPATNDAQGVEGKPGGKLARLRNEHHLSQAQLGEIDPSSVTIKLATLGLRGVASNILWTKATDYKMKKDWTNFGATLNQITKVQPNFLNVWINQAWNLSYNCSVEFDDYRDRYRWVIKGFKFLNEGIKYNEGQPKLPWELGRYVSQKIGKADEVKQYRRLFSEDVDYRESLPVDLRDVCLDYRGLPDNWLVGKGWYQKAIDIVDNSERRGGMGQSPLIFYSSAPMCQMNYADRIEKEGTFGETAKESWASAANEWSKDESSYGNRRLPVSFRDTTFRLNDLEAEEAGAKDALAKLDELVLRKQPKLREELRAEKRSALTAAQREALDTPAAKRNPKQLALAAEAEDAIRIDPSELARGVNGTPEERSRAKRLANEHKEHKDLANQIRSSRSIVNFDYWRQHSATEQEPKVLDARKLIYAGDRAYANNDLVAAYDNYQKGLRAWRAVLDAHPEYVADQTTCEDLVDIIKRYRHILERRDEQFPEPFLLQDVIDSYKKQTGEAPALAIPSKPDDKKSPGKPEAKTPDVKKPADAKKPVGANKAADEKKAKQQKPGGAETKGK